MREGKREREKDELHEGGVGDERGGRLCIRRGQGVEMVEDGAQLLAGLDWVSGDVYRQSRLQRWQELAGLN